MRVQLRDIRNGSLFFALFLVLATAGLFVSGERTVRVAEKAAQAAQDAADAAKASAEVTRRTLISGNRAWIRINQIGIGGGGLAIDKNGASVSISFNITNVGNAPATKVTPYIWMVALKDGGPFPPQVQQENCARIRNEPFSSTAFTLFPNETFPANRGYGSWSLGTNVSRADLEKAARGSADKKHFALSVVGCVDYAFPTDPETHHQTGFIFNVETKTGLIPLEDEIIPADQIRLTDVATGIGQYAD